MSKCPHCDHPISGCDLDEIVVGNQVTGPSIHANAATCPRCHAVLGVFVDPYGLINDVAKEVVRRLGRG